MAKKKTGFDMDWSGTAKSLGAELLDEVESVQTWIDTGVLAINKVCSGKYIGGGIPAGKIIEIYGDSASGKSLIGTNILKGVQTLNGIPILLDAERSLNKEFAIKASKIDPKRMLVLEADTLQAAFNKITSRIKKLRDEIKVPMELPIVIIYDSIAASPSEREFAETELDMETASKAEQQEAGAGADKPGERAKICSKELRKLPPILKDNNASVVFINQIREKIGIMYGDPTTTAGGGRALEYYATMRLKLRANKVPKDNKGNVLGVNITVVNTKNRCYRPFVEAKNMHLFFEQGVNPFGGLLELLIQDGRIVGKGSYTVQEPWAGGKKITFKASKERNDVPYETLLECPALVDAESPDQIQYYLDLYKDAILAVENKVADEDDTIESILEG